MEAPRRDAEKISGATIRAHRGNSQAVRRVHLARGRRRLWASQRSTVLIEPAAVACHHIRLTLRSRLIPTIPMVALFGDRAPGSLNAYCLREIER